jgi:solute:Na+ symporter, SSS family
MFAAVTQAKPNHLVMPGSTTDLGHTWYVSTLLLVSLSFYMWPQFFGACFTARSGDILRRNAVVMPLYSLTQPLVIFVGLSAVLILPGLGDSNLALMTMVRRTFPAWFLGVIGGAGALTAMVPAAIQLLTGATIYAKNLFRPIFAPSMSDQQVAKLAKIMVLVLTFGALFFAVRSSLTFVSLLLLGYAGVAQLFSGVVLGLYSRRVTTSGVFAGVGAGISIAALLMLTGRDPYRGLNAGFIALCLNFVVTGVVSLFTPVYVGGFDETRPAAAPSS